MATTESDRLFLAVAGTLGVVLILMATGHALEDITATDRCYIDYSGDGEVNEYDRTTVGFTVCEAMQQHAVTSGLLTAYILGMVILACTGAVIVCIYARTKPRAKHGKK